MAGYRVTRRGRRVLLAAVLLAIPLGVVASQATEPAPSEPIITTIAGTANPADLPARDLGMAALGVASSPRGVYVSDRMHNVIREVDVATGSAHVIAGTGEPGRTGDGGPAVSAAITAPGSLALAPDGALIFTSDSGLRRVAPGGTISTLTTAVASGFEAVTVSPNGVIFVVDSGDRIARVNVDGTLTPVAGGGRIVRPADGVAARDASFWLISGLLAVDDTTLLVADPYAAKVYRVTVDGSVTTYAGRGDPGCDLSNGNCGSYSGDGGPAVSADLHSPEGLALDNGNVLIADSGSHRVRQVDLDGMISTIAGDGSSSASGDGGPGVLAGVPYPQAIAVGDRRYVVSNYQIRALDRAGVIETVAGTGAMQMGGDGHPATTAQLEQPTDVAAMPDGSLLIADGGNNRIRRVAPDGTMSTFAGGGPLDGGGCCDSKGRGDGGPAVGASLYDPLAVAVAPDGTVYISESARVRAVDPGGRISTFAGSIGGFSGDGGPATAGQLARPAGLQVARDGSLLIADPYNARVRRVDAAGTISTLQQFNSYDGSDVAEGPDGKVYVAVFGNVVRLEGDGTYTNLGGWARTDYQNQPPFDGGHRPMHAALAFDDQGRLYHSVTTAHQVLRQNLDSTWETIAGSTQWGFAGDGGPVRSAQLKLPAGLAVAGGRVMVADLGNDRIRSWSVEAPPIDPPPATTTTTVPTTTTLPPTDTTLPPTDTTPPTIAIEFDGPLGSNGWYVGDVTVRLHATDSETGVDRVEHRINNGSPIPDHTAGDTAELVLHGQGGIALSYRAVDRAGNASPWTVRTVKIDRINPQAGSYIRSDTGSAVAPNGRQVSGSMWLVNASCSDLTSGCASVELLVDGVWTQVVRQAAEVRGHGDHTIEVRVKDFAGNEGYDRKVVSIDYEPPSLTTTFGGEPEAPEWSNTTWEVTAQCHDAIFQDSCSIAQDVNGWWQPSSGTVSFAEEGVHNVYLRAADPVDNYAYADLVARIDHTPPSGQLLGESIRTTNGPVSLEAVAYDPYLIDGHAGSGAARVCFDVRRHTATGAVPLGCFDAIHDGPTWRSAPWLPAGIYSVRVRVTDAATNSFTSPARRIVVAPLLP